MPWFKRSDGSMAAREESVADIEFDPSKLKTELEESSKKQFGEFSAEMDTKFAPIVEMAAQMKADRETREASAKAAAEKKSKEDADVDDEDFLIDPKSAVAKQLQPTQIALARLAAKSAKSDALGDEEYYHGDIKKKVDEMIAGQPLSAQLDPSVIKNCFKLVMYDSQKDIADGKIKSRNSSATFQADGTGAHSGGGSGEKDEALTDEEKRAAKVFGMSEKDWSASKREISYV